MQTAPWLTVPAGIEDLTEAAKLSGFDASPIRAAHAIVAMYYHQNQMLQRGIVILAVTVASLIETGRLIFGGGSDLAREIA